MSEGSNPKPLPPLHRSDSVKGSWLATGRVSDDPTNPARPQTFRAPSELHFAAISVVFFAAIMDALIWWDYFAGDSDRLTRAIVFLVVMLLLLVLFALLQRQRSGVDAEKVWIRTLGFKYTEVKFSDVKEVQYGAMFLKINDGVNQLNLPFETTDYSLALLRLTEELHSHGFTINGVAPDSADWHLVAQRRAHAWAQWVFINNRTYYMNHARAYDYLFSLETLPVTRAINLAPPNAKNFPSPSEIQYQKGNSHLTAKRYMRPNLGPRPAVKADKKEEKRLSKRSRSPKMPREILGSRIILNAGIVLSVAFALVLMITVSEYRSGIEGDIASIIAPAAFLLMGLILFISGLLWRVGANEDEMWSRFGPFYRKSMRFSEVSRVSKTYRGYVFYTAGSQFRFATHGWGLGLIYLRMLWEMRVRWLMVPGLDFFDPATNQQVHQIRTELFQRLYREHIKYYDSHPDELELITNLSQPLKP
ncbi:hypothetical protein [Boudabousia marimammalium]|uniref:Uncharacterized protein n=1 Tax=Boudabousia marimammalium TaxID=156892 RepID=A0A1Q5PT69_9ACTO|nr:hypothetical protein [Boudabousia marimammalium]OKL50655.1 hypothetical protein BM477_01530 [Boudabousia marimammalium]